MANEKSPVPGSRGDRVNQIREALGLKRKEFATVLAAKASNLGLTEGGEWTKRRRGGSGLYLVQSKSENLPQTRASREQVRADGRLDALGVLEERPRSRQQLVIDVRCSHNKVSQKSATNVPDFVGRRIGRHLRRLGRISDEHTTE